MPYVGFSPPDVAADFGISIEAAQNAFRRVKPTKGNNPLFSRQGGLSIKKRPLKAPGTASGRTDYNFKNHVTPHSIPMHHIPNSTIIQRDDQGNVVRIRHYDKNGDAYKDVDYTDHGRPDTHKVPHTHIIEIGNKIDRKKGAKSHAN